MEKQRNIQAIISVNGISSFYLYYDDIKKMILNTYKFNMESQGHKVDSIEVELNSPPLTYDELKNREK